MTKYTAANILKGQAEIDRMRSEINMLISMLSGLIGKLPGSQKPEEESSNYDSDGLYVWKIKCERQAVVFCYGQVDTDVPLFYEISIRNANPAQVRKIHSDLSRLVDFVLELFPQLKSKLDPFIAAAEAA